MTDRFWYDSLTFPTAATTKEYFTPLPVFSSSLEGNSPFSMELQVTCKVGVSIKLLTTFLTHVP